MMHNLVTQNIKIPQYNHIGQQDEYIFITSLNL